MLCRARGVDCVAEGQKFRWDSTPAHKSSVAYTGAKRRLCQLCVAGIFASPIAMTDWCAKLAIVLFFKPGSSIHMCTDTPTQQRTGAATFQDDR